MIWFFPLAPALFSVAASVALISIMEWWSVSYFTSWQGFRPPPMLWTWFEYVRDPSPSWKMIAALAGSGLMGATAVMFLWRGLAARRKSKLFGSARWQTIKGAKEAGISFTMKPPRDGILIGKWGPLYASLRGDGFVSLTAQTGAGKGVSFVIPNAMNWGGPLFCFSVKRDVMETVAAERERMGDRVFVFDVTEPAGLTHRWSGFGEVRRFTPDVYDDIQRIMWTVIPETRANNPYWDNAARKIATAVAVMLAETRGAEVHIPAVLETVEAADYEQRLRDMIFLARAEGKPFPAAAVNIVLSWLDSKAEEGAAAVRENILTALSLWHIPRVAAATSHQDFRLGDIRSQQISVFVCAQSSDIARLRPIYSLFFTQLINLNSREDWTPGKHRPIRTLLLLDERWALGEMKEVDNATSFIRSAGFRFANVMQTKDQLKKNLGPEGADNVFNNMKIELIFGGSDFATAKEVSEQGGTNTEEETSTSKPLFGVFNMSRYSENKSKKARPLILPQEVQEIPDSMVIVKMKGKPLLKLQRIFWYKDECFRGKTGLVPPIPTLNVTVNRDTGIGEALKPVRDKK